MQAAAAVISEKPRLIKDWAADDRPREKLILKGPDALSDSELICLLVGKGTARQNAMDLARKILEENQQNLQNLARRSMKDLLDLKIHGFGIAKASAIAAA